MSTTLLQIVQDAVDEIGAITRPSIVVASTDQNVKRLLVLSNREGRNLARSVNWTMLQRLHTFTTTASTEEYSLPSDYSRLIPDSEWDRTNYRPIMGPLSAEQWQTIKSGLIGTGIVGRRYRIVRSATSATRTFRVDPTPTVTGDTLAFEYLSDQWCTDTVGTTLQSAWAADTDLSLLDRDLMTLGLIVRFKRAVGLDYASEADEYAGLLSEVKSHDRPAPTLSIVPAPGEKLLGFDNLPETGLTG